MVVARSSEAAHTIRKQAREGLLFGAGRLEPRERMRLLPLQFESRRQRRLRSSCAIVTSFSTVATTAASTLVGRAIVDIGHWHRRICRQGGGRSRQRTSLRHQFVTRRLHICVRGGGRRMRSRCRITAKGSGHASRGRCCRIR
jgi:hypothetical protein